MAFDRNEAADVAFGHRPVLLDECMEGLVIRPGGIYLDGTLGRAGHSWEIVRRLNAGGRLIGLDRDETALEAARQRLAPYADRVTLVHSNFSRVAEVLDELGIPAVDGMLFDLGVSSPQLDDAQRGFSYMHDAPLDMRMDHTADLTARTVVNEWSYEELRRILYEYGEERYAPAIARRIVAAREEAPIETTGQLVELIKSAMPPQALREKQHPAKRSFQALRIAVNGELEELTEAYLGAKDDDRAQAVNDWLQLLTTTTVILPVCFETREVISHLGVISGMSPNQYDVFNNITAWTVNIG